MLKWAWLCAVVDDDVEFAEFVRLVSLLMVLRLMGGMVKVVRLVLLDGWGRDVREVVLLDDLWEVSLAAAAAAVVVAEGGCWNWGC